MGQYGAKKALVCGSQESPPERLTAPAAPIILARKALQSKHAMPWFSFLAGRAAPRLLDIFWCKAPRATGLRRGVGYRMAPTCHVRC